MTLEETLTQIGQRARAAAWKMTALDAADRKRILEAIAVSLSAAEPAILEANAHDVVAAREKGLAEAMLDRLTLTPQRFAATVQGVREVAELPDPVGKVLAEIDRPNGLKIRKVSVPLGVVAMIYEARPNVTVDAAALCLKSGNAAILRCGSEAAESSRALVEAINAGAVAAGLPEGAVQLVPGTSHEAVRLLVQLEGFVDLVIPRGGERLIRAVTTHARVPVLKHYKGVCHIYVAPSADQQQALEIIVNAKCQRPGVCNALESLLVDSQIADVFLPKLEKRLTAEGVTLHRDAPDPGREYLSLDLSLYVVGGLQAAIDHINTWGSHHSDAILSENAEEIVRFQRDVDSAVVYANASTRFTDGAEFGMGAEIGICTDKLHARGPMGLDELTTYKYIVTGAGQIRE